MQKARSVLFSFKYIYRFPANTRFLPSTRVCFPNRLIINRRSHFYTVQHTQATLCQTQGAIARIYEVRAMRPNEKLSTLHKYQLL